MPTRSSFLLMASLWLGAAAPALAGVVPLATEASLIKEALGAASPVPFCFTAWERDATDPPDFHLTDLSPGNFLACGEAWLAHSDADSLVLHARWDDHDPGEPDPEFFLYVRLQAEIRARIEVTQRMRVVARRAHAGTMDTDLYGVAIVPTGQPAVVLIDPVAGPDVAARELGPGEYTVVLTADARDEDRIPAFDLRLAVIYEPGTVTSSLASWTALKRMYGR